MSQQLKKTVNEPDVEEISRGLHILNIPKNIGARIVASHTKKRKPQGYLWVGIALFVVLVPSVLFMLYLYSNLNNLNERLNELLSDSQALYSDAEVSDQTYLTKPLVTELYVDGEADKQVAQVGETINYIYSISNRGNVTFTKFIVIDSLNPIRTFDLVVVPDRGHPDPLVASYSINAQDLPGPIISQVTVLGISSMNTVAIASTPAMTIELAAIDLDVELPTDVFTITQPITFAFSIKNTGSVNVRPTAIRYSGVEYPISGYDLALEATYSNALPISAPELGLHELEIEVRCVVDTDIVITDSEKIVFRVASN